MSMSVAIPLCLYLLSGLINYALAFKSPEQWAAYVERYPRGAALRRALRKVGFDLPGLIRLAQTLLAGRGELPKPAAPGSV